MEASVEDDRKGSIASNDSNISSSGHPPEDSLYRDIFVGAVNKVIDENVEKKQSSRLKEVVANAQRASMKKVFNSQTRIKLGLIPEVNYGIFGEDYSRPKEQQDHQASNSPTHRGDLNRTPSSSLSRSMSMAKGQSFPLRPYTTPGKPQGDRSLSNIRSLVQLLVQNDVKQFEKQRRNSQPAHPTPFSPTSAQVMSPPSSGALYSPQSSHPQSRLTSSQTYYRPNTAGVGTTNSDLLHATSPPGVGTAWAGPADAGSVTGAVSHVGSEYEESRGFLNTPGSVSELMGSGNIPPEVEFPFTGTPEVVAVEEWGGEAEVGPEGLMREIVEGMTSNTEDETGGETDREGHERTDGETDQEGLASGTDDEQKDRRSSKIINFQRISSQVRWNVRSNISSGRSSLTSGLSGGLMGENVPPEVRGAKVVSKYLDLAVLRTPDGEWVPSRELMLSKKDAEGRLERLSHGPDAFHSKALETDLRRMRVYRPFLSSDYKRQDYSKNKFGRKAVLVEEGEVPILPEEWELMLKRIQHLIPFDIRQQQLDKLRRLLFTWLPTFDKIFSHYRSIWRMPIDDLEDTGKTMWQWHAWAFFKDCQLPCRNFSIAAINRMLGPVFDNDYVHKPQPSKYGEHPGHHTLWGLGTPTGTPPANSIIEVARAASSARIGSGRAGSGRKISIGNVAAAALERKGSGDPSSRKGSSSGLLDRVVSAGKNKAEESGDDAQRRSNEHAYLDELLVQRRDRGPILSPPYLVEALILISHYRPEIPSMRYSGPAPRLPGTDGLVPPLEEQETATKKGNTPNSSRPNTGKPGRSLSRKGSRAVGMTPPGSRGKDIPVRPRTPGQPRGLAAKLAPSLPKVHLNLKDNNKLPDDFVGQLIYRRYDEVDDMKSGAESFHRVRKVRMPQVHLEGIKMDIKALWDYNQIKKAQEEFNPSAVKARQAMLMGTTGPRIVKTESRKFTQVGERGPPKVHEKIVFPPKKKDNRYGAPVKKKKKPEAGGGGEASTSKAGAAAGGQGDAAGTGSATAAAGDKSSSAGVQRTASGAQKAASGAQRIASGGSAATSKPKKKIVIESSDPMGPEGNTRSVTVDAPRREYEPWECLSIRFKAIMEYSVLPHACKKWEKVRNDTWGQEIMAILEMNRRILFKIWAYYADNKAKNNRPTMTLNKWLELLEMLGYYDPQLTMKVATSIFSSVSGEKQLMPQVHYNNADTEIIFDEWLDLLARTALSKFQKEHKAGSMEGYNIVKSFIEDFISKARDRLPFRLESRNAGDAKKMFTQEFKYYSSLVDIVRPKGKKKKALEHMAAQDDKTVAQALYSYLNAEKEKTPRDS